MSDHLMWMTNAHTTDQANVFRTMGWLVTFPQCRVGPPLETRMHTPQQLQAMGLVGIYCRPEDRFDFRAKIVGEVPGYVCR